MVVVYWHSGNQCKLYMRILCLSVLTEDFLIDFYIQYPDNSDYNAVNRIGWNNTSKPIYTPQTTCPHIVYVYGKTWIKLHNMKHTYIHRNKAPNISVYATLSIHCYGTPYRRKVGLSGVDKRVIVAPMQSKAFYTCSTPLQVSYLDPPEMTVFYLCQWLAISKGFRGSSVKA